MARKKKIEAVEKEESRTDLICDKCEGDLFIINPKVMMNGLTLLECEDCKERCYKLI